MNLLIKPRNYDDINGKTTGNRNGNNVEIRIGTWNIRTLYKPGALKIVTEEIEKYKIPLVAVQEIRWTGEGTIRSNNSTIFYSGTKNNRHGKGVGLVVNEKIVPCVKSFVAINEHICFIRMIGRKSDIIVINCYALTEEKEEEEKNIFYEDLERTFDSLPKNCIKVIVGDFNAQIGKEATFRPTIGHESLHTTSNDNGMKLIDFSTAKNLIISSTYFPRKNIHKQTWTSPDGKTKTQIDHVIIDKRYQTCIKNVRTYRGADGDSDHYLVIARFVLTLSVSGAIKNN